MSDSCCCFVTIQSSDVGIIERMGKFSRFAKPGLNFIVCPMEFVAGKVSLRVRQVDVRCETKTIDNVFVSVSTSVQFAAQPLKVCVADQAVG
jgi:regulator of protease activity HflC (stomatin/prohibitin superfamily)